VTRSMQDIFLDGETVRLRWLSLALSCRSDLERWQAMLDPQELDRAQRFYFSGDRRAYVAVHALARSMIAKVSGMTPATVQFSAGPDGKPRLVGVPGSTSLQFNISRSRTHVVCGLVVSDELGVDIESADHAEVMALAQRYFAPSETELMRQAAPDRRGLQFARLWTLKEAFLKATGDGLRCPLDKFSFTLDPIAIRFQWELQTIERDWQFVQLCPCQGQVIAVAVRRHVERPILLDAKEIHPSLL
jgi:4'-phosphopantetheinyl transferase